MGGLLRLLDELYATLVVRPRHSDAFAQHQLWRYAADFKTNAGKQLGIKLTRRAPGVGDPEVYFDPGGRDEGGQAFDGSPWERAGKMTGSADVGPEWRPHI